MLDSVSCIARRDKMSCCHVDGGSQIQPHVNMLSITAPTSSIPEPQMGGPKGGRDRRGEVRGDITWVLLESRSGHWLGYSFHPFSHSCQPNFNDIFDEYEVLLGSGQTASSSHIAIAHQLLILRPRNDLLELTITAL